MQNIIDKQISATIKRVNALFNKRLQDQFDKLNKKYKRGLHTFGDKLDRIGDNCLVIAKWGTSTRAPLIFALKAIGHISFLDLKHCYFEVVRELVDTVLVHYLVVVPVQAT